MSLRKRIILSICFTIGVMMAILSALIYSLSADILDESEAFQMETQLIRAKENIDLRLQVTKLETEKLALNEKTVLFFNDLISAKTMSSILTEKMNLMNKEENYYKDLFLIDLKGVIVATTMKEAESIDLSSREYLKESIRTLETITSDALIAKSDGSLIVNTVTPIYNASGTLLGFAGIAIKAEYFSRVVSDLELGDHGYYGIVDSNNRILAHPNKMLIYETLPDGFNQLSELEKKDQIYLGPSIFNHQDREFQISQYIESNKWYLIAALPEREMYNRSNLLLSYVILAGSIGIIIAIGVGYYMGNEITKPVVAITETLRNLTLSNALIGDAVESSIKSLNTTSEEIEGEKQSTFLQTEDEIGNLNIAIHYAKHYLSNLVGYFEKESEKLIRESEQLSNSVEEISYRTAKFIATLSHDLKTSITLIKGYSKGLSSGIISDEETKILFLEGILSSAEDIEKITCDILDTAYEAQCVPKLYKQSVELESFVEELMAESKHVIMAADHILVENINIENRDIKIDEVKIKRVWHNILSNSLKFSSVKSEIHIDVVLDESTVSFKIRDFGIGIHPDAQSKIFNMFYRNETTDTKGYGLGLFIAKSILEAHGSTLQIDSEYGKGTSVSFSLKTED